MSITGKIERGWRESQIQIPKNIMKEERINTQKVMLTKDKDILSIQGRNMMTMKSEKTIEMSTIHQEKMKRDMKEGKIIKGETM